MSFVCSVAYTPLALDPELIGVKELMLYDTQKHKLPDTARQRGIGEVDTEIFVYRYSTAATTCARQHLVSSRHAINIKHTNAQ